MEGLTAVNFNWSQAATILKEFGGAPLTLRIRKSGLPFFDALRLYGALDLYVGVREDIDIHDTGANWLVTGRARRHRLQGRDEKLFVQVWKKKTPNSGEYCSRLRNAISAESEVFDTYFIEGKGEWDAALQDGIRGISARSYVTLQSAQTSKRECKASIPLADALFATAGRKRTEGIGSITFLPIFEGQVDLSKVVSPLRSWIGLPNVLCAQALALLALKTSLLAEGYHERLRAVAFNTDLGNKRSDNYSGIISISSTAIGKIDAPEFVVHLYRAFRQLVSRAWQRQGRNYQTTRLTAHALAMGYWMLQPVPKNLSALVTSQESLYHERLPHIFVHPAYVKEVFRMSYGDWNGDHEAVRRLARAAASAIKWARGRDDRGNWLPDEDQRKNWYDEVTMLRSAPSAKTFIERLMILVEQGHEQHSGIGTANRDEAFDPKALFSSLGTDRHGFETFRDLFRMYLVQESTHQRKEAAAVGVVAEMPTDTLENHRENEEAE